MTISGDENDRLTAELDAALREADRLRHGVPIEGDFVCPAALERDAALAECEKLRVALIEACAHASAYAEDDIDLEAGTMALRRIAELRALAGGKQWP